MSGQENEQFSGGFCRPKEREQSAATPISEERPVAEARPPATPPAQSPTRPASVSAPAITGVALSTLTELEGYRVGRYLGLVDAECILGANAAKDMMAGIRDFIGGRVTGYENVLKKAKKTALDEIRQRAQQLGGNGVLGLHVQCEAIQIDGGGNMLMATVTGTAVQLVPR